ncbi:hypothetical protein PFISCL1PPCAC_10274, partial [Pristionchus fissidentatus]
SVFWSYCNSTRATIAKPASSADVLELAFSCALDRSYLYFSAIDNSPRCCECNCLSMGVRGGRGGV